MKLTSPIGRIVQGNPLVANLQFDDNNQPKLGNDGKQQTNWYLNVAFEKANPETAPMIAAIRQEAATAFPALFPCGPQEHAYPGNQPPLHAGGCIRNDFAFKIKDGDAFDNNGKPNSAKEGWGGCWIVQFSSYLGQIRCGNGNNGNSPITEVGSGPHHIKCGDYVRVAMDFKTNGWKGDAKMKPGLFMNPEFVQLVGYGDLIQGGIDPNEAFKTATAYIPAGMSTTPGAALPQPTAAPGQLGQPAPQPAPQPQLQALPTPQALPGQVAPQPLPTPQAAPTTLPTLPVLPNHGVVQAALTAPVYQISPAAQAGGHTLDGLRAQGYTDDVLLANGFIVKVG